jgi:hypothetical protein
MTLLQCRQCGGDILNPSTLGPKRIYCSDFCRAKYNQGVAKKRYAYLKENYPDEYKALRKQLNEKFREKNRLWIMKKRKENPEKYRKYKVRRVALTLAAIRTFREIEKSNEVPKLISEKTRKAAIRKRKNYRENPELYREITRRWEQKNYEKKLQSNRRYRALQAAVVKAFREVGVL